MMLPLTVSRVGVVLKCLTEGFATRISDKVDEVIHLIEQKLGSLGSFVIGSFPGLTLHLAALLCWAMPDCAMQQSCPIGTDIICALGCVWCLILLCCSSLSFMQLMANMIRSSCAFGLFSNSQGARYLDIFVTSRSQSDIHASFVGRWLWVSIYVSIIH